MSVFWALSFGSMMPNWDVTRKAFENFLVTSTTTHISRTDYRLEKGSRSYTFPITKRYDRDAMTRLLLAASQQFNVFMLVTNAIDPIASGMWKNGIRKLKPKICNLGAAT